MQHPSKPLSSNSRRKHLRPEKHPLRPLNHLLIYTTPGMVHNHRSRLVVDFGVDARVTDQVDDPLLAFVVGEAEASREVPVKSQKVVGERREEAFAVLTLYRSVGGSYNSSPRSSASQRRGRTRSQRQGRSPIAGFHPLPPASFALPRRRSRHTALLRSP